MTLSELCEREVGDLHAFFVDWRAGRLQRTAEAFDRMTQVMDAAFIIIPPSGKLEKLAPLLERLEVGHGSNDAFGIEIRNFVPRQEWDGYCLATYEEWQDDRGVKSGRLSSVLFKAAPEVEQGVQWLSVHETWLPGKAPR